VFRWGGEEFVVLMPHTGPGEARVFGERIPAAVAERPFPATEARPMVTVTVSIGVAGSSNWPIDPHALLASADAACYKAKARGRNQVSTAA
jgi:diguanylate cyclase (GGDEF)-like protein